MDFKEQTTEFSSSSSTTPSKSQCLAFWLLSRAFIYVDLCWSQRRLSVVGAWIAQNPSAGYDTHWPAALALYQESILGDLTASPIFSLQIFIYNPHGTSPVDEHTGRVVQACCGSRAAPPQERPDQTERCFLLLLVYGVKTDNTSWDWEKVGLLLICTSQWNGVRLKWKYFN